MAALNFPAAPADKQIYDPGPGSPVYQFRAGIGWLNIGTGATLSQFVYTATGAEAGGGTIVPVPGGYLANMGSVARGGAVQTPGDDVDLSSGTDLVWAVPLVAGETILFVKHRSMTTLDALSKALGGSDIPSIPTWRRNTMRRMVAVKSANYTVTLDDIGNVIANTGAAPWTLALPAAAAAGNGFPVTIRNVLGGAKITIDPNGAETVNGLATIGAYGGDSVELICDGTGWHALFQSPFSIVAAETLAVARATVDLALPSEFTDYDLLLDGFEPAGSTAALGLRFSIDGGASFYSGSGAYGWNGSFDSTATTNSTTYKSSGGSVFGTTAIELTPGNQTAQNGSPMAGRVRICTRGVSRYPAIQFDSATGNNPYRGSGSFGVNTANINALRLGYSGAATIGAGARYSLIGRR